MRQLPARLLEAIDDPTQWAGVLCAVVVCTYAGLRGGRTEKLAAAAFAIAYVLSVFAQDLTTWVGPQLGMLGVDMALLCVLVALALRTDRTWTLFAAGFHLLSVLTHVAIALDSSVRATAYTIVLSLLTYMIFASLAVGVYDASGRRRATG